jgi:uncharacterized protein involved in response to NO
MMAPGRFSSAWETLRRDPFRLFFLLGAAAGIVGVGQWILWAAGNPPFMTSFLHAAFQSQGFLGFFIVGFLLTALPRFTGAPYVTLSELSAAVAGASIFLVSVFARKWELSQAGFLVMLAILPVFAVRRLAARTKPLPPSFLLLAFGLIHAALGSLFLMVSRMGAADFALFEKGRWMVELGFPLCMVLGITAKLAPFLTGHTGDSPEKEGTGARSGSFWKASAPHGAAGAGLLLSFLLEPHQSRFAAFFRAAVATAHLLSFALIGRFPPKRTATALLFWLSCWMILAGLWLMAFFPGYKAAFAHVVFIGGFSLMILSFGLLVVLTHMARAAALSGPMTGLKAAGGLVAASLLLRVAADFFPGRKMLLLGSASSCWVLAVLVWLAYVLSETAGRRAPHSPHKP